MAIFMLEQFLVDVGKEGPVPVKWTPCAWVGRAEKEGLKALENRLKKMSVPWTPIRDSEGELVMQPYRLVEYSVGRVVR